MATTTKKHNMYTCTFINWTQGCPGLWPGPGQPWARSRRGRPGLMWGLTHVICIWYAWAYMCTHVCSYFLLFQKYFLKLLLPMPLEAIPLKFNQKMLAKITVSFLYGNFVVPPMLPKPPWGSSYVGVVPLGVTKSIISKMIQNRFLGTKQSEQKQSGEQVMKSC